MRTDVAWTQAVTREGKASAHGWARRDVRSGTRCCALAAPASCLCLAAAPALRGTRDRRRRRHRLRHDAASSTTAEPASPGHCRQRATSDLLVGGGFSSVLALGDTQYHVGALEDFEAVFDKTWGRVKPIIRPGGRQPRVLDLQRARLLRLLQRRGKHSGPAGDRDKGYYSFDIGSWHLIALNSQCDQVAHGGALNGCAPGSPQERWLQYDLAAHRTSCTLAYWHSPRFNSGFRGNSPAVAAVLGRAARGGRRRRAERRRPQLRALRAAGPERGARPGARHPRVRRRHGRRLLHRLEQGEAEQRGAAERHVRRARADAASRPATNGASSPRPAGPSPTPGAGACHGRTPGFTPSKPPPPVRSVKTTLHDPRDRRGRPPGRHRQEGHDLRARRQRHGSAASAATT